MRPVKIQSLVRALSMCFLLLYAPGCSGGDDDGNREYTVTFDAKGGSPTPEPLKVPAGEKITEPEKQPEKQGLIFTGWHTQSGLKFNFRSATVDNDMTLYAQWWKGPEQFIFINGIDLEFNYSKIKNLFGSQSGKRVAVGAAFILYCFERPREVMVSNLRKHLQQSLEFEVPVLVQLDAITFMDARPDLWNWWDESQPGYNPDNKNNVEWTSWSADDAVKIGWLNWGRQIRLKPMPNLMSLRYRQAVAEQMGEFLDIIMEWYDGLPENKKWLLAGVKSTGEMGIGVNNWYYPNGNDYLDMPADNDPQTGINVADKPSRGVQTIGYAGLKTGEIKTTGTITGRDIANLAQKHSEIVSKLCYDRGIPRERIFAHAGGAAEDFEACVNSYSCPAWSFYHNDATHPADFAEVLNIAENSDAPYFGIAEWSIGDPTDASRWQDPISEALAIPKCRFLSVYANVVGSDVFNRPPNMGAVSGIKAAQQARQ